MLEFVLHIGTRVGRLPSTNQSCLRELMIKQLSKITSSTIQLSQHKFILYISNLFSWQSVPNDGLRRNHFHKYRLIKYEKSIVTLMIARVLKKWTTNYVNIYIHNKSAYSKYRAPSSSVSSPICSRKENILDKSWNTNFGCVPKAIGVEKNEKMLWILFCKRLIFSNRSWQKFWKVLGKMEVLRKNRYYFWKIRWMAIFAGVYSISIFMLEVDFSW